MIETLLVVHVLLLLLLTRSRVPPYWLPLDNCTLWSGIQTIACLAKPSYLSFSVRPHLLAELEEGCRSLLLLLAAVDVHHREVYVVQQLRVELDRVAR